MQGIRPASVTCDREYAVGQLLLNVLARPGDDIPRCGSAVELDLCKVARSCGDGGNTQHSTVDFDRLAVSTLASQTVTLEFRRFIVLWTRI